MKKKGIVVWMMILMFALTGQAVAAEEADSVSENEVSEAELAEEATDKGMEEFVTRLYDVCLDRKPDASGLKYWTDRLKSGEETGIHTAYDFVFSEEFQNKCLCNEDYVKYLYRAFMGRTYDAAGLNYWLGEIDSGTIREAVFNGFATSKEFEILCKEYGIQRGVAVGLPKYGTVPHGNCTVCGKVDGVTRFVSGLYRTCLDRNPNQDELNYWRYLLWVHAKTGSEVASDFVFSKEFQGKNLTDEQFVLYMYRAFFGREAQDGEESYWNTEMFVFGRNKSFIFAQFIKSKEFVVLCKECGIEVGEYTPVEDEITPDTVAGMTFYKLRALKMDQYRYLDTVTKDQASELMVQIRVPVWDFESSKSMNKVTKYAVIQCNKNFAAYLKAAFKDLYNDPSKPVIHPNSCKCYKYDSKAAKPAVKNNHTFGTAIDINPSENPAKKAMVTKDDWAKMPEKTIEEKQKKAYTIYQGSPYYNVFYLKYHMDWLGDDGKYLDAMHFEL